MNYCWTRTQGLLYSWDKLKNKLELKLLKQVSKYVEKLLEHELNEEQIVVNTFATHFTNESQGIIDLVCQCVEELVIHQFDINLKGF